LSRCRRVPGARFFGRVSARSLSKSPSTFSINNLCVKVSFSGKAMMLLILDCVKQTQIINSFIPINSCTRVSRSTSTSLNCPETGRTLSIYVIHLPKNFGNREVL
jgi:hypothetical protein